MRRCWGVCAAGFWVSLLSSGCLCGAAALCLCRRAECEAIIFTAPSGGGEGPPEGPPNDKDAAAIGIEMQQISQQDLQQQEEELLLMA